ncbi:MAG TPA: hypothetical protein VGR99_00665, partial [Bradyrhizobium sp.]|nr:hypothetical protein [Bradyrhizobium sp.]
IVLNPRWKQTELLSALAGLECAIRHEQNRTSTPRNAEFLLGLDGQNSQAAVKPACQKYSTLPKFGNIVCVAHPSPPKGRSYVVASAGWELRWTRAASKAGVACRAR